MQIFFNAKMEFVFLFVRGDCNQMAFEADIPSRCRATCSYVSKIPSVPDPMSSLSPLSSPIHPMNRIEKLTDSMCLLQIPLYL